MSKSLLIYHTFLREYSGADATEVIQAVYQDAKEGTGATFQEWWDYQKKLWMHLYQLDVPENHTILGAPEKLLQILVPRPR